ncbi:MAG: thiamine pyrophosphate-dependent enzyme, partial [Dehalococcoidia bacterium]
LSLPRELFLERMSAVPIPDVARHGALASPGADPTAVAQAAEILVQAQSPLILVGDSGRHPQSVAPLIELAESLGAPVVSDNFRMNFPTVHPLYAGTLSSPYLEEADVILIIDQDIPYLPIRTRPRPDARLIQVDIDPVKANIPLWFFPVDLVIQADSSRAIPALSQALQAVLTPERRAYFQSRGKEIEERHQAQRSNWHRLALDKAQQRPISPEWLSHCLAEAVEEDDIVLSETVTNSAIVYRYLRRTRPGTLFQSGGSSLGWGLGAALGAKLAAPDRMVITLVGDGDFVFCCPTAALWAADVYHAPLLCVIFNNQLYRAPKRALRETYGGESCSERTGVWVGMDIAPPPDYALLARACRAYGETVTDPQELEAALRRARDEVRGGRSAVLDVLISEV